MRVLEKVGRFLVDEPVGVFLFGVLAVLACRSGNKTTRRTEIRVNGFFLLKDAFRELCAEREQT